MLVFHGTCNRREIWSTLYWVLADHKPDVGYQQFILKYYNIYIYYSLKPLVLSWIGSCWILFKSHYLFFLSLNACLSLFDGVITRSVISLVILHVLFKNVKFIKSLAFCIQPCSAMPFSSAVRTYPSTEKICVRLLSKSHQTRDWVQICTSCKICLITLY